MHTFTRNCSFRDLQRKLTQNGWTLARVKGSHHCFRGRGRCPLVIPVHKGKVLPVYVRSVDNAIRDYVHE